MHTLRGRRALVTGASGALGGAIARALAAEGTHVVLSGRSLERLRSARDEVAAHGVQADIVPCDLSDPAARDELVGRAEQSAGPVDILVNCAGVEVAAPFEATPQSLLESILAADLAAPLVLTRQIVPGMLARGCGHVVAISSIGGKAAVPFDAAYAAAKWGLVGLTQSLRAEYRDAPIGFSVVCPGFVTGDGMYERLRRHGVKPPRAVGTTTPHEVAKAVVYAIRHDSPEVLVGPVPIRPMLALAALAPRTSERVAAALGATDFGRNAAIAEGNLHV